MTKKPLHRAKADRSASNGAGSSSGHPAPELEVAAEALAAELLRYDELAADVQRTTLDSEKGLGRAARALAEAAASQERMGARLGALVAAISSAREHQEAAATALLARAREIQARVEVYQALDARLGELGVVAKTVNEQMQEVAAIKIEKGSVDDLLARLATVDSRVAHAIESARQLSLDSAGHGIVDVEQRSSAVLQQMQAIRNKLGLLRKSLVPIVTID